MGRFVLGLIIGLVVGVLAMTYNPNLPQEVRTGLTELAALVMRGTERAAEPWAAQPTRRRSRQGKRRAKEDGTR